MRSSVKSCEIIAATEDLCISLSQLRSQFLVSLREYSKGWKKVKRLKETLAQVFPCEFCKISKNTFFTEHLWATASEVWNTV